ncbi:hypothetical protein [Metabacillus sp. Hm71]|uniref:hypothetical protein n=1 Tax=Metabacillus sp. Hm71 TaxID=3450743 RepID=UPI003F41B650
MNLNERIRKNIKEKGKESAMRRKQELDTLQLKISEDTIDGLIKETRMTINKAELADKYYQALLRISLIRKDMIHAENGDDPWFYLHEAMDIADKALEN